MCFSLILIVGTVIASAGCAKQVLQDDDELKYPGAQLAGGIIGFSLGISAYIMWLKWFAHVAGT